MQRLESPFPLFFDRNSEPLEAGFVSIGVANGDPDTDPLNLFADAARTQALPQPLRTLGGYIVSGANAVAVFVDADDYSIRVRNASGDQIFYVPSVAVAQAAYQPLDSDLTAIAALSTTAYGRALLTLANQAALQAAVGLPAALPLIGGTVSGPIMRQNAGVYVYHADPAMTGGRIFVTAVGASDPTSQPGDIWLEVA